LSSFGFGEVQNLTFVIVTTTGPYHGSATALARDEVKIGVIFNVIHLTFAQ